MKARENGPRLGRGLAALLGEPVVSSEVSGGIRQTPIDLLDPGPFQPRRNMNTGALEELAASVKAQGVLQPLLIRPHPGAEGRFQIVAGERRWRAAAMAGLHEVPALVRALSDSEAVAGALVENLQREDLNPIEEAEGYNRLLDEFGMTQELLAKAVGKSRSHLSNMLRLLNLPERVKDAVRNGDVSAGHARALLAADSPEAALATVLNRGLSVRQTEALTQRKDRSRSSHVKDPDIIALEQELSAEIGLKVEISGGDQGGSVRIQYHNLDQLDVVLARLRS